MKDNFILSKMTEKFDEILEKYLPKFDLGEVPNLPNLEELQTYE